MTLLASDIALLREVLPAARAKGWSRVLGDGAGEHLPEGVTVVAEWDQDGSLITLTRVDATGGLRLDVCGVVDMDVVSLEVVVDALAAWRVLPVTLSSAYRMGRENLAADVRSSAELGVPTGILGPVADVLPVLGDALTYWSTIACSPEVAAVVASRLDGLLDRDGLARRRQVESVVSAVMDALAGELFERHVKPQAVDCG